MQVFDSSTLPRALKRQDLYCDLAIAGGGISGVCAAISAARAGIKVVLVQDRPVLGGNASSEVRLWILGASSHLGNNNRWARESGIIGEILVENMHNNPEGNPVLVDALLLDLVLRESNITLLLNTAIDQVSKDAERISSMRGFCPQNSTEYVISAPLFCDASGDGILGFLSGAAFRMGAEKKEEFDEGLAPPPEYGELLGHSLYFYSRDTGRPVQFSAPAFALDDITKIPRFRKFNTQDNGCKLWWLEYGGRIDTVHDTETIKMELWKIVYGIWDYIKNSGNFPEAETMTLEWVGMIPGKRESRRFEGDYMLTQRDIVEQRQHPDFVSYGGWAIDLHRADGVYSEQSACNQYHAKAVYGIPYRCMYSRNINNLFLAGRIISASHVAFGSTRVMATCGHNGQAVGIAAAMCIKEGILPRALARGDALALLQRELVRKGQYIPGYRLEDEDDIARAARLVPTSEYALSALPADGPLLPLEYPIAQMLPLQAGKVPAVTLQVSAKKDSELTLSLRISTKADTHTPEIILSERKVSLHKGENSIYVDFDANLEKAQYAFVCLHANADVAVKSSLILVSGLTLTHHKFNPAVAVSACQQAPEGSGVDSFEFWCPARRPAAQNLAFTLSRPVRVFSASNLTNGLQRPIAQPNAWVAALEDERPTLMLCWKEARCPRKIVLVFDNDLDHPMESVLMGHPEHDMPFCVQQYRVLDGTGRVLVSESGNHHSLREHSLPEGLSCKSLLVELTRPAPNVPASLFEVRVYE